MGWYYHLQQKLDFPFKARRVAERAVGMPLEQLAAVGVDADAREAMEDRHYWKAMGYQF